MTDDPFLLFGTREVEQPPVRLTAGRLSADLLDGNLRTIRYDGVEVLRALAYLVRDRDWGTYSPTITDLSIDQRADAFDVRYTAQCKGAGSETLRIAVHIEGRGDGLVYRAEAVSPEGFETNRCGFCVLHPILGLAGAPVTVEHVDGQVVGTHFPDVIEPWQPFKNMRAITHRPLPGVAAECRLEGDVFEMEDQRNWSDASYKTYVRPLALPWPYRIPAGSPQRQSVSLRISDSRTASTEAAAPGDSADPVTLAWGEAEGILPAIGLVMAPEEVRASLDAAEHLAALKPQELIVSFDPGAGHGVEALRDFASLAALHKGRTLLEIALPCLSTPEAETRAIAAQMAEAGFRPDAILISPSVDRQSTPPGSAWPACPPLDEVYAAAHAAFAGIRIGGGMLSYFTELNRKRVPAENLAFISHCTCPIVHAADDLSVMQTLEALPFITRSVRAIYGDKPYRIGPSTIPMRQNPYGSRTMPNPGLKRMAMADRDPRHTGRFAAAFALAYLQSVLEAGLECLTLSALTGPFGVIAGRDEPAAEGTLRPLGETVAQLCHHAGKPWRACISSDPTRLRAFAVETADGWQVLLANLTAGRLDVSPEALAPDMRKLNLAPYEVAAVTLR
ncbi:hypothetical protein BJF93_07605 [Xaviernesmea oryzae]|uniref:Uncharacterized protein n=1 Tax=Xaviernesmea oryzae TaxID=464029 RepID=A0A1Q9B1V2_9HYPH|nr:hypothetical protein [Xaviernesmea oryzae]OLP61981.1 hypothetical protein BJF93_07605 [Xaviernesmea oryzae]SEK98503.1 hypothetical protein SAMN04487976_10570 [Xaviernesmea oryzae]